MKLIKRLIIAALIIILLIPVGAFVALKLIDLDSFKPRILAVVKEHTGRELAINGNIDAVFGLTPSIEVSDITLSNASWSSNKEMVKVGYASVSVSLLPLLNKQIQVNNITLSNAKVTLESSKKGSKNWELKPVKSSGNKESGANDGAQKNKASKLSPEIGLVEIENINLRYIDHKTNKDIALKVAKASLKSDPNPIINASIISGDASIAIKSEAKDFNALVAGTVSLAVNASGKAGESIALNGSLKDFASGAGSLAFNVNAKGNTIRSFNTLAGSNLPSVPAYNVKTNVSGNLNNLKFKNIDAAVDNMSITGNADVKLSGKKPYIKANLKIPAIKGKSGGSGSSASAGGAGGSGSASSGRVIPDIPLPVDGIKAIDGDIQLAIGSVGEGSKALRNVTTSLSLKSGKLRARPFSFNIAGNRISGSLTVNANGKSPSFFLSANTKDMGLGKVLNAFGNNSISGGNLTFSSSLSAYGNSSRKLAATLKGETTIFMNKASYNAGSNLKSASQFVDILYGSGDKSKGIPVNCVAGKFNFNGGVMRPQYLAIDAAGARVDGAGSINLATEKLAMTFYPKSKTVGLADLTLPVKMGGSFAAPRFYPDPEGAVTNAGKVAIALTGVPGLAAIGGSAVASKLGITDKGNPCFAARDHDEKPDVKEALKNAEDQIKSQAKRVEKNIRNKRDNIKQDAKDLRNDLKSIKDAFKGKGDGKNNLEENLNKNLENLQGLQNLF